MTFPRYRRMDADGARIRLLLAKGCYLRPDLRDRRRERGHAHLPRLKSSHTSFRRTDVSPFSLVRSLPIRASASAADRASCVPWSTVTWFEGGCGGVGGVVGGGVGGDVGGASTFTSNRRASLCALLSAGPRAVAISSCARASVTRWRIAAAAFERSSVSCAAASKTRHEVEHLRQPLGGRAVPRAAVVWGVGSRTS